MGSQSGPLDVAKWGEWDQLHRIDNTTHHSSVDSILAYDENTVITGCSDGIIRYN